MKTKLQEQGSVEANIFHNQPTGVLAFDSRFQITICNKSFFKQTKINPQNIEGSSLFDVIQIKERKADFKSKLLSGDALTNFVEVGKKFFEVSIMPLFANDMVIGGTITLGEELLGNPKLDYLSKAGFKSVIENAPMTIMIFRTNGSVFYTNQHYKELWNLSDKELYLIHEYYNIFDDQQLNNQAIGPYLKKAFQGNNVEIPVVKYVLDYSGLGRTENSKKENWLLGYFFPMRNPANSESLVALIFTEITRQVEAEQAFKLSQERLELALEGGGLGIWDWDLEKDEIVYNDQWAKILDYQLDEIDISTWKELVHPDDIGWVEKKLDDHILGKSTAYLAEYRVKTKSGKWKWVLDRGKVVEYTDTGKAKRISGTHLDITSKKHSEEVLKESEERYRSLIDNLPTGVAIVQDGKVAYANRKLHSIVKASSENELVGYQASKWFKNVDAYQKKIEKILNSKEADRTTETEITDLKGNNRCVEITSIPFMLDDKPAVQSIVSDIQNRKDIEEQTLKAEKLLSQLFENAPMGIVMLGFDDEILKTNKGFEQIFGYEPNEVIGKYINDIIVPESLEKEGVELSKDSGTGKMVYCESQRVSKSNEIVPVMIYTLPVIHEGQRLGVYGIYVDLRHRVKIEEELKVRNLELDNFVYKVSHDLRSPLASILGLINLVKLEGGFKDSLQYLNLMESQVHKLDHFIHDVLSHSKNLKMALITSEINFNDVLEKCIADLNYLNGFKQVEKTVTIEGDNFISDQWRINEIFRNLIANSIKYRDSNKANCELNISIKVKGKSCEIIIFDNGIGIQKESVPHIFEMFYRATDTSKGSGIGLYIVKNAVDKLNGTIQIDSEFGQGTSFIITLPELSLS